MLSDGLMATKGIIQQVEAFINERIQMEFPNSVAYIKFIEVTQYDKKDRINTIKEAASSGLPVKQEWMTLLGYDPLEAMANDWLETKLGLSVTKWITPVKTSYTQSDGSNSAGAPTKKDGDLTDDGEASRDKRDAVK
jgi:hypothetical protein